MSASEPISVEFSRDGRAIHIILSRPDKRNALDQETLRELQSVAETIRSDSDLRVATIRGAGGNFSAGADLAGLKGAIEDGNRKQVGAFLGDVQKAFDDLSKLPVPLIAIVDGFALAGGLELLLACDLAIASEDAVIGDQHTNYGLVGAGGTTQRLPKIIGSRRAKELILTGGRIDGTRAEELGLVNRSVAPESLDEEASGLVDDISEKGTETTRLAKHLIDVSMSTDLGVGLELEREEVTTHLFSAETEEGLAAFEEGREPRF